MTAKRFAGIMRKHGLKRFTDRDGREYFYSRRPHVEDIKIVPHYVDQDATVELYDEVKNVIAYDTTVWMDELNEWLTNYWST
jgi:hypothetical protein